LARRPGKYNPTLTVVPGEEQGQNSLRDGSSLIDEIMREGARRMPAKALQAEVDAYSRRVPPSGARTAAGWWSETAATSRGRC
jgi:hypothetical protein